MKKYAFIDRDGTILNEPEDYQVDSVEKISLKKDVTASLQALTEMGYRLVMITNQDGLGTESFPKESFDKPHVFLMDLLESQGIHFDDVLVCPHFEDEKCGCRKPDLGLVVSFLKDPDVDWNGSCVVGDRQSDMELAKRMGCRGFSLVDDRTNPSGMSWKDVVAELRNTEKKATMSRKTKETAIDVTVVLGAPEKTEIATGIGFFDHMIEQIARHGNMGIQLKVEGDLHVDDHHVVEDTALALGSAIRKAAGDKIGMSRYGFVLPMDESKAEVLIDLCGRAFLKFKGDFSGAATVGGLSTEMVPHFFRSFADSLGATIHASVEGENTHHMVESLFKALAKALGMATKFESGGGLPSTKGAL